MPTQQSSNGRRVRAVFEPLRKRSRIFGARSGHDRRRTKTGRRRDTSESAPLPQPGAFNLRAALRRVFERLLRDEAQARVLALDWRGVPAHRTQASAPKRCARSYVRARHFALVPKAKIMIAMYQCVTLVPTVYDVELPIEYYEWMKVIDWKSTERS